jgi:7-carboxy-7-deazaguanine synthase
MKYKVVEKFISINGEGNLSGQLAVFIRFAGCNLSCSYCDTSWANKEDVKYELMSGNELYDYIKSKRIRNVTLTGGEPLLQDGIYELLALLASDICLRVEIETNGSVDISRFSSISPESPVFTMDYKLPSSGMEDKMLLNNFNYLKQKDAVKFVVGSSDDLDKVKYLIEKYNLPGKCNVHLSPVFGRIEMETIVEFMKQNEMNLVRLQPQLHKFIWHPDARGV